MSDVDGQGIPATVDVLVAGAGAVGACTASGLATMGASVLVVDGSSRPGAGSRAAAGVGVPSVRLLSDPVMLDFALAGRQALAEDLDRLRTTAPQPLAVRCGLLRPVPTEQEADQLGALASEHPEFLGSWVPAADLGEIEPGWRGRAYGAFHDPDAQVIDAAGYVDTLVTAAHDAGALVRTGVAVRGLERAADGIRVTLEGQQVRADRVVVACGAWTGRLPGLPPLPVRPIRGQMVRLATGRLDPSRPRHIVSGSLYVAPAPDGIGVLVGATEEDVDFAEGPTAEGVLLLLAHAAKSWPGLRSARMVSAWSGFRAVTPDGRPLIGELPDDPRLIVASGHGGQGILTGAHTGRLVVRLIEGGRPDLTGFSPARTLAGIR